MTERDSTDGPGKARSRGKGALRVYDKLREDILRMELSPGELLDEVEIGKQFNLSRSPVREALIRLSAEGLIKDAAQQEHPGGAPEHRRIFPVHRRP